MRRLKQMYRMMVLIGLAIGTMVGSAYAESSADPAPGTEAGQQQVQGESSTDPAPDLEAVQEQKQAEPSADPAPDLEAVQEQTQAESSAVPAPDLEADQDPLQEEAGDEPAGENSVSMLEHLGNLIAYITAADRADAWQEYAAFVAKLYRDAVVLTNFGLETPEQAERFGDEWVKAQIELNQMLELESAASASLANWPAVAAAVTLSEPDEADEPQRASAPMDLLRQANMNVNTALRGIMAAKIQHQSGLLTSDELLAAHRIYLEARIAAADAKETYYYSVRDFLAEAGTDPGLTDFLKEIEKDDAALIGEWFNLLQRYGAENGQIPAATLPEDLSVDGEPAEPMPYMSIMMPGAEVHSPLPPLRTGAGDIYVPLRPYAEALQLEVLWMAESRKVSLSGDQHSVVIALEDSQAEINDTIIELPGKPFMLHSHVFVPLSFFEAALKREVYWNEEMMHGFILP